MAVTIAFPILAVRILYSVLGSFAPAPTSLVGGSSSQPTNTNSLSKFSSFSGSWAIFLFMSLFTEYVVVVIYILFGFRAPIEKVAPDVNSDYELSLNNSRGPGHGYPPYQPLVGRQQGVGQPPGHPS